MKRWHFTQELDEFKPNPLMQSVQSESVQLEQSVKSVLQAWQELFAARTKVDWHVEQADVLEQVRQFGIKLLQALQTPELRVKLAMQSVQID